MICWLVVLVLLETGCDVALIMSLICCIKVTGFMTDGATCKISGVGAYCRHYYIRAFFSLGIHSK